MQRNSQTSLDYVIGNHVSDDKIVGDKIGTHINNSSNLTQEDELLEQETFSVRFQKILNLVENDQLSLEDITEEVEAVRQANYHGQ
jgi:hypothetical protein